MSSPANILDNFRSYSYHHILVACDNSRAAEHLSSQDFRSADFTQIGVPSDPDTVPSLSIPVGNDPNNPKTEFLGNYVVLINGLVDSRYVIQKVEWETVTASSVNSSDRGNSLSTNGSMIIDEPRGFEFLNVINGVQNLFETDATGLIFVLKTIFVGHTDNQGTQNVFSDIRPLNFIFQNITATFDERGGTYQLKFVGLNNGASRLPQLSRAAETNGFTPRSRYLRDVVGQFSEILTKSSRDNYESVKTEISNSGFIAPSETEKLRRVEFDIVLNTPYEDDVYVLDNFDEQYSEDGQPEGVGPIHIGISFTVEQVIQRIMSLCSLVQKELTEGVDGVKYRYKISSAIEMQKEPAQDRGNENVTTNEEVLRVTYYVTRVVELDNISITALLSGQESNSEITQQQIENNLITFDYFFTGKNTDIRKFDMKIDHGLLFLQTLKTTYTKMGQKQKLTKGYPDNKSTLVGYQGSRSYSSVGDDGTPSNKQEVSYSIRPRTPVFPGTTDKDVVSKNLGVPTDMTLFNAALQQHAAFESLQTSITIRGNPYLMSQTNRPVDNRLEESFPVGEEEEATQVMKNWNRIPALAKINIRMPKNSETLSGDNSPELIRFWYDGYYYILRMTHKFESGEFSQVLHLIAMPQNNFFDPLQTSTENNTADSENNTNTSNEENAKTQTQLDRKEFRTGSKTARNRIERTKQPAPSQQDRKRFRTTRGGDN